ncbi:MAG: tRNA1(Val) (adenine(37)-N6)-methyltransferase [Deltaproteobacteria bacterium]|nr:tRNA1(Val) (adenine(37)-N6)-methyltransferase [Deltaproteobacteria bacterium]
MIASKSSDIMPLPGETIDFFKDGRLKIIQSKTGYRFSVDALLLSDFVTIKKYETVVDLGTGCGVIPMSLLVSRPLKHVYCIEIQPELAFQAMRNAKLNNLEKKMSVILGDFRHMPLPASSANVVVCNPPYRKKENGRINPDKQRAIARHEIHASLDDIIKASKYLLSTKGRLSLIYPAERLADLIDKLRQAGFEPKKLRVIYPDMGSNAKLVLMEAWLGAKNGLTVLPPLIGQGDYSIENQA